MRKISKIVGKKENSMQYPEDPTVSCQSLVGIELEVEEVDQRAVLKALHEAPMWNVTGDGSLRNGLELVSLPVSGVNLVSAIKELQYILDNSGTPALTKRCSLHVHIDMRDMSVRQLFSLLVVYTIFENELFNYVGEERKDNPYCVPLSHADNLLELLEKFRGTDAQIARLISQWPKYSAVNLKTLGRLGTLEFRHHPGTLSVSKIFEWVNILLCLKQYVIDNPKRNTQSIIDKVCTAPEELIEEVFKDYFNIKMNTDVFDRMLEGARVAQQVYRYRGIVKANVGEAIDREGLSMIPGTPEDLNFPDAPTVSVQRVWPQEIEDRARQSMERSRRTTRDALGAAFRPR